MKSIARADLGFLTEMKSLSTNVTSFTVNRFRRSRPRASRHPTKSQFLPRCISISQASGISSRRQAKCKLARRCYHSCLDCSFKSVLFLQLRWTIATPSLISSARTLHAAKIYIQNWWAENGTGFNHRTNVDVGTARVYGNKSHDAQRRFITNTCGSTKPTWRRGADVTGSSVPIFSLLMIMMNF